MKFFFPVPGKWKYIYFHLENFWLSDSSYKIESKWKGW